MERATALSAECGGDNAEAATTRMRRSPLRYRKAVVAITTVAASLAIATPAHAWPMCGF